MGTRHTYRIIEKRSWTEKGKPVKQSDELVLIYGQYDGYPSGVPSQVANFLSQGRVVNGYGLKENQVIFNGAGCMAAQLIDHLKDGVGNIYINVLSSRGKCSEDYLYDIIVEEDRSITMVAYHNNETPEEFFRGTPQEFLEKFAVKEPEENQTVAY